MSVNDIITFLKTYGIQGAILLLLALLIWIIVNTEWFKNKSSNLLSNMFTKKSSINISHVVNHNMFNYIDFWLHSKVGTIKFLTEYRTVIFRKYLTIYLMKYRDNMQKYITSNVYEDMDEGELWKSILSLLNGIVYDYEKEMEQLGIPKMIIEKMKERNNETITLIIDLTENICSSEFYVSEKNLLKIFSIQNILLSVLQNTITNSTIVCDSINGSLKGQYVIVDGKKIIEKDIEH